MGQLDLIAWAFERWLETLSGGTGSSSMDSSQILPFVPLLQCQVIEHVLVI